MSRLSVSASEKTSLSIFADAVSLEHKLSLGLSLTAYLAGIAFIMDLLCMMGRLNYYELLVDALLMAVFLLNYFDRVYVRFLCLNLLLSVILDAAWLAMKIDVAMRSFRTTGSLQLRTGMQLGRDFSVLSLWALSWPALAGSSLA
jgi:hypothetical protein